MQVRYSSDLAEAWEENQVWRQNWHKTASPVTTASGLWVDLSMAAGTPKYNAYVGNQLAFTPLVGGSNNGINVGVGGDCYVTRYNLGGGGTGSGIWPANAMLLDYCGFYPLVDMDSTDPQEFDNTGVTSRYESGMRCMVVTTTPQNTGSPVQVLLEYVGSNGVATAVSFFVNATPGAGCLNSFSTGTGSGAAFAAPFVPLGIGTTDVAQLTRVQLFNSAGGFAAFVLVKPILEAVVYDTITPYELEFPRNKVPPKVVSGAYLNHIVCPMANGSVNGITRGTLSVARASWADPAPVVAGTITARDSVDTQFTSSLNILTHQSLGYVVTATVRDSAGNTYSC